MSFGSQSASRTRRLAHRGDHRSAPEDTLAALLAALEIPGCDGLEFDVRVSADGVPVLLHDETLARVQQRDDRVDALDAEVLGKDGIPTLAAVLAAVPRSAFLDIELKTDGGRAVAAALRDGRGPELENAVVSSFQPATLASIRTLEPAWPRWLNALDLDSATIALAKDLGCSGVSVDWRAIDAAGIARARTDGLVVVAWTVITRRDVARLWELGVVAICVEGEALEG